MSNLIKTATEQLEGIITSALERAMESGDLPQAQLPAFVVEIPADLSHGDFATNAAMVSAKAFRRAPRQIAQALVDHLDLQNTYFDRVEIAGPGFINFFLNRSWFTNALCAVLTEQEQYGRSDYGQHQKVMVEFVSANPTGPMHMGNARGGAIGDCLASVLDAVGYDVTREFYVNDAGNQIQKFGKSLSVRYLQIHLGEDAVQLPEECYQGEDIKVHAQNYTKEYGDKLVHVSEEEREQALIDYALPKNIEGLRRDLEKYRIQYDVWFRESTLHESGAVMAVVDLLKERDMAYEKDGTIWYKATAMGAEKDEVLVRSNGIPTYFTADIAYHLNKFVTRGFDRVIDVWGADHHGHVARLKGALDAAGVDSSKLDIVLMQMVRLMKDGKPTRMSKRTGKAITLTDLLEEIPIDAARFFFNMREPNSTLDFDLDLAVEQSSQNPVYYVQYAHARICSILKNFAAEQIHPRGCSREELDLLTQPEEIELIRTLATYPQALLNAARSYDPAHLTIYARELATAFHKFYNACRCRVENESLMQARLNLCLAVRITLRNVLSLMKIQAPEVM